MDAEGYVRITGRIKEIIIRGGENIAPKEIEDLLRTNPKVVDVYVYGIPDERLGEDVAAAIKLKQGEAATPEEFREFCEGRIARFKIPRNVRFVDEFPMTASGKVPEVQAARNARRGGDKVRAFELRVFTAPARRGAATLQTGDRCVTDPGGHPS